ncbi:MAG: MarC family protein [Bacteroidetes bacterium]|jgi:multiple antibiotic resistance protein|nr:MarC family protein [Bacteroidota bacterium]
MNPGIIEFISVFMVLFAVIDITGSIPVIIDIEMKTGKIDATKASLVSLFIMLLFLLIGEPLLGVFGVDLSTFAIAGSFILFFLGIEMVLGIELFKYETVKASSIVPVAFPLIAGAGTMTTLISLKSQYNMWIIVFALLLNMIFVYFVLRSTNWFHRVIGATGILILRKFFGIILLAIAIKLFLSNTGITLGK